MSFWDSVKGAAQAAGSYAKSQLDEVEEYKARYESLSDEAIFRKFQNSSGARKLACAQLLKERGFRPDQ